MRGEFLRTKASFMIMVIVCSIFTIYLAMPVTAEEEIIGCCEEAKSTGEHCVMTSESECATMADGFSPTTCEQTSYCKAGCCISADGVCSKQVGRLTCESLEGHYWMDSPTCDVAQCTLGCCTLGEAQCFYTTEKKCGQVTSGYGTLELDFRTAVGTEFDCLNICKQTDEGCCVTEAGTCTFTTRGACPSKDYDASSGIGLFKDTFCSNENLDCECKPHARQDCVSGKEKVYWFDSCGNREEIVTEEIEGSENAEGNGDCSYELGTICGYEDGKAICKDLNCVADEELYFDSEIEYLYQGQDRGNGESWCMYDAKPGVGSDPVGSRHYRYMCINGEEVVEPCADARTEICKNGLIYNAPYSLAGDGTIIQAQCIENIWEECITTCNTVEDFSDVEEDDFKVAMRKDKACCKKNAPNCYWMDWVDPDVEDPIGRCYPAVAPGGKFWNGDSVSIEKEPSCELATTEYSTLWEESMVGLADWKCSNGCEAYTNDYLTLFNNYCNSIGDCGAQYNYEGKWTNEGLYRTWDTEDENSVTINGEDYIASSTLEDPLRWNTNQEDPLGRLNVAEGIVAYSMEYSFLEAKLKEQFGADWSYENAHLWVTGGVIGAALAVAYLLPSVLATVSELVLASAITAAQSAVVAAQGATAAGATVSQATMATMESTVASTAGSTGSVASSAFSVTMAVVSIAAVVAGVAMFVGGLLAGDRSIMETGVYFIAGGAIGLASLALYTCFTLCATGYGAIAAAVVAIAAAIVLALAGSESRTVTMECTSWQPPTGGVDCYKCDEDFRESGKPCSEYKCKSLGQTCEFIPENEGTNRETCYDAHPDDVTSPQITDRMITIVSHGDDITDTFSTEPISGGNGFNIVPKVPAYSKVIFGIETNELSQCKIGKTLPEGDAPFSVLPNFMPNSYYDTNHNYSISGVLPEQDYNYYVGCQDPNGNAKNIVYKISFLVESGNDITPPLIVGTTLEENAYIPFGVEEILLGLHVEEVSRLDCRWSSQDQDYEFMENNVTCASAPLESTRGSLAECGTKLPIGNGTTKFFFRCKDYPIEHPSGIELPSNPNLQSYQLNVQLTQPLIIEQTAPEGKLFTNDVTLQVKTQAGAENGKAKCYYNDILFYYPEEDYYTYHEQSQSNLPTGDYRYNIECVDAAGNTAESNISFSIDVDLMPPEVIGVYKSGSQLIVITDEPSTCEYSEASFKYGQGEPMSPGNSVVNTVSASMPTYHIICEDLFNNKMPEIQVVLFESIS